MYIKSPLNYIGGKYKILSSIFEILPPKVDTFVDLFAGGFNVGINAHANKIICNDQITYLINLYKYFKDHNIDVILGRIKDRIDEFELTKDNAEGYKKLRTTFNIDRSIIDLFILSCYSFNHQIRFNSKHEFNTPFGTNRSSYNLQIEKNLIRFCRALQEKNIVFNSKDFLEINLDELGSDDIVYCDPPYLLSNGSYNDGNRGFKNWTVTEEKQLLDLLNKLDHQDTRFALSNVLYHKGMSNDLLIEWSKQYNVHFIDKKYSNCSYHFKNRNTTTVEVLITNYRREDC